MQKLLLLFCFISVFNHTYTQDLGKFDPLSGFEKYQLGMKRSLNDTCLKETKGGQLNYLGFKEVIYQYTCTATLIELAGLKANDIMITCDNNDKLIRVYVNRIVLKNSDANFYMTAKNDFNILYSYLRETFHSKGKRKRMNQGIRYEWEKSGKVIQLQIQKAESRLASIDLVINYKYVVDSWKKARRKERG
jgi:hypothetical protein